MQGFDAQLPHQSHRIGTADREKLEKLARFAVDKDLIVISDEIYAELTYEGEHLSIAALPLYAGANDFLHGFSKAFYWVSGWFFACGPNWLIEAMMKIHQYCMMCAPILVGKLLLKLCGTELRM